MSAKTFLFLDIETTGLTDKAGLLEIYAAQTNSRFDILNVQHIVLATPWNGGEPEGVVWDTSAVEMHHNNGLLDSLFKDGPGYKRWAPPAAQLAWAAWLSEIPGTWNDRYLAGSSVHTDRTFLKRVGFGVDDYVSHRHFDLSTFKALDLVTGAGFMEAQKKTDHRAKTDVIYDIEVAKKLRNVWLNAGALRDTFKDFT